MCVLGVFLKALLGHFNAYESFTSGAKEGLGLFADIFPSLLAMMLAVSLLRETGLLLLLGETLKPIFKGIPAEIFALSLFRPISGGASLAVMIDIFKTSGVDSLAGKMASVIQGSTDTTFYVITLYFSTVGITRIRNSLWIGLFADFVGISMGIILVALFMV